MRRETEKREAPSGLSAHGRDKKAQHSAQIPSGWAKPYQADMQHPTEGKIAQYSGQRKRFQKISIGFVGDGLSVNSDFPNHLLTPEAKKELPPGWKPWVVAAMRLITRCEKGSARQGNIHISTNEWAAARTDGRSTGCMQYLIESPPRRAWWRCKTRLPSWWRKPPGLN